MAIMRLSDDPGLLHAARSGFWVRKDTRNTQHKFNNFVSCLNNYFLPVQQFNNNVSIILSSHNLFSSSGLGLGIPRIHNKNPKNITAA